MPNFSVKYGTIDPDKVLGTKIIRATDLDDATEKWANSRLLLNDNPSKSWSEPPE